MTGVPTRGVPARPRRGLVARAAAAAAAAVLALAACDDPGSFRGIALDPPEPAPELRLAGAAGDTFDLAGARGDAVLLFFGYTRCPDICPTTLADWARVREELGRDAERVRFVFVSVDPERDTPERAMSYARQFDPSFVGYAVERAALPALLARFRIAAYEEPVAAEADGAEADSAGVDGYHVAHSSQTFLIDPEGRLRVVHPMGSPREDLLADVRRVLD